MICKDRYWKIVGIAYLIPVLFAILDVIGAKMWVEAGGSEPYLAAESLYMLQFWSFGYLLIGLIGLTYYLVRGDKSEALALVLVPLVLLWSGVEDIIYFIIKGIPLADVVKDWSMSTPFPPSIVANLRGHEQILGPDIAIGAVIGIILAYYLAKWLYKVKG
jgi:membrane protein DedA with SNARE-associated domain